MAKDFVYFVRVKGGGPIKIGRASNPWDRVATMQTGHWQELEMLGVVSCDRASGIEARLHREFATDRIRGEWFTHSERLWDRMCELCDESDRRDGICA